MDTETKSTLTKKVFPSRFYDAFFINEYGKIESLRASRHNNTFSIILINIERPGDRDPSEEGKSLDFFKRLVTAVLDSLRDSDIVGIYDDKNITAILPETDYFGSLNTIRKISGSIANLQKDYPGSPIISSQATFPQDGKGYGELLSAAMKRASLKKESLWEKEALGTRLFWEIISELTGKSFSGFNDSSFDAGDGYGVPGVFIDQINDFILREMTRTPLKKGILYLAAKKISQGFPIMRNLNSAGKLSTKAFLVGEKEDNLWNIKNATPIVIDDPRLRETFFTFYLSEDAGYALIYRENWGSAFSCFHSADPYLVEGLISKFQREYSLQEQLG